MQPVFLFFILLHLPLWVFAQTPDVTQLAQSSAWKKLLHYQPANWGKEKSAFDGPGFFFSPTGGTDPVSEMQATIQAFKSRDLKVGKYKEHPLCAFPVRRYFLEKNLKIQFAKVECPKFDEFMQTFQKLRNISLVFSSAYVQNPASMFGHTFLKINTDSGTPHTDVGINYAALVSEDENPFAFVFFGTTGGYRGHWSTENYYAKIREYSQGENRDLWEYEIDLSPEETRLFVQHLWEIETNSYFHYYFFDENCSYQILAAIEAIKPEWNITEHTIYMIPGESLKNLFKTPGIVKNVHLRPSQYRQVAYRYLSLSDEQKKVFHQGLNTLQPLDTATTPTLEAWMSYVDYLNIKKKGKLTDNEKAFQNKTLAKRAARGEGPVFDESQIPAETRVDLGHESYSLLVTQGVRKRSDRFGSANITQFKIKSAYHDLMNNDVGYKKYSHLDFMAADFIYDSDLSRLRLNSATLVNVMSIPPMNFLSYTPAWKVDIGLSTNRDYGCLSCRHVFAEGGIGLAQDLGFGSSARFYGYLTAKAEFYRQLYKGVRYGPGYELGLLLNPTSKYKMRFGFSEYFLLPDEQNLTASLQTSLFQVSYFLARNWEVRMTSSYVYPREMPQWREWSANLGFVYFFN